MAKQQGDEISTEYALSLQYSEREITKTVQTSKIILGGHWENYVPVF